MGRGPRRGGRKKFTDFKTLEKEAQSIRERKIREENGIFDDSDDDEPTTKAGAEASDSDASDSSSEEEGGSRRRGVDGLIEVNNPNMKKKPTNTKVANANVDREVTLTRREREQLEAQRAKERYFKLQKEGKTEQARKDLERLSLIRKQREEAAKKRQEEKAAQEARKAAARKGR